MIIKIVSDLQELITKGQIGTIDMLAKANMIAEQLGKMDVQEWINKEIYGYEQQDTIPEYRIVKGRIGTKTLGRMALRKAISDIESESQYGGKIYVMKESDVKLNAAYGTKVFDNTIEVNGEDIEEVIKGLHLAVLRWLVSIEIDNGASDICVIQNIYGGINPIYIDCNKSDMDRLDKLVELINNHISELEIGETKKELIKSEMDTIKGEREKDKPNKQAFKTALIKIASMVGDIATNVAASIIVNGISNF